MKSFTHLLLAALLLAASSSLSHAQDVWGNVEMFQLPNHRGNQPASIAADQAGRLFVAGYSLGLGLPYTFLVRRSVDGGANWETVLTFEMPSSSQVTLGCQLAVDPAGQVYLVHGNGDTAWQGGPDSSHWIVRKSVDHGDTWDIVDDYALEVGFPSMPSAVTSDAAGAIYVSGYAWTSTLTSGKPLFRRSTNGGQSWTTVDGAGYGGASALVAMQRSLFAAGGDESGWWSVWRSTNAGAAWARVDHYQSAQPNSYATGLTADRNGNLYAVGRGTDAGQVSHWIVRRSTDGGGSWATVDDYQTLYPGAGANAVTTDAMGRVLVVGIKSGSWAVRSSSDGGASWMTTDDFSLAPNGYASAVAVSSDAAGNVFVTGKGMMPITPGNPPSWFWIVRRLAAPPRLSFGRESGQLRLSWLTNATGFLLQSATTLANGGDWQDFPTPPAETNGQNVITVGTANAAGFFRLRK